MTCAYAPPFVFLRCRRLSRQNTNQETPKLRLSLFDQVRACKRLSYAMYDITRQPPTCPLRHKLTAAVRVHDGRRGASRRLQAHGGAEAARGPRRPRSAHPPALACSAAPAALQRAVDARAPQPLDWGAHDRARGAVGSCYRRAMLLRQSGRRRYPPPSSRSTGPPGSPRRPRRACRSAARR